MKMKMKPKKPRSEQMRSLIEGINKKRQYRAFKVEKFNEEDRTVEVAASSEYPVNRYYGMEILDHGKGLDLERLRNGAPLLLNHNPDKHIGVVDSIEMGKDRVLRAVVRFGRSELAEEIWNDVKDGIRQHISIGYRILAMILESEIDDVRTYRVTEWEPYEISFATIAADPTVGVGRTIDETENLLNSQQRGNENMQKTLRNSSGQLVRAEVDAEGNIVREIEVIEQPAPVVSVETQVARTLETEQKRVADLIELSTQFGDRGVDVNAFIKDSEKTPEDYQRALLNASKDDQRTAATGVADDGSETALLGLSDNEVRQYSFLNVIRTLVDPTNKKLREAARFEMELSEAVEDKFSRTAQGIIVPHDVLVASNKRSIVSTATAGELVGTDHASGSFIDLLYNRSAILSMVRTLTGLVGDVDIPSLESGVSGGWIGEDQDAPIGALGFGNRKLSPKTAAAVVAITRRMLKQSSPDIEAIARDDIATALALTIDLGLFYGTGGDQPLGLDNILGINTVDFAGDQPTWLEVVQMETEISSDNADVNAMAHVMNSGARGHFKSTQKFENSNGMTIWEQGNMVNGYNTRVSNQVKNNDHWLGNWQDVLLGMWGGLDLMLDPYTEAKKGRLNIIAHQDVDVAVRRTASFCRGRKSAVIPAAA
jgi:HK97 family phage major capsid protein